MTERRRPVVPARRVSDASAETLPHNLEAERALLGALMMRPQAMDDVSADLAVTSFYRVPHGHVFAALRHLREKRVPADFVTVKEALREAGHLEEVGPAYLSSLVDGVPQSTNAPYYGDVVVDYAVRRAVIQLAGEISARAYAGAEPAIELADYAQRAMMEVSPKVVGAGPKSTADLMPQLIHAMDRGDGAIATGIRSGFADLDVMTGGFQRGDMVILAARPSLGKTTFAMNVATDWALRGLRVVVFSLEMTSQQLLLRMVSADAQVDSRKLSMGRLGRDDSDRVIASMNTLMAAPMVIDDTSRLYVGDMRTRARRVKIEQGALDLIVVDYIQLLSTRGTFDGRQQEVTDISRQIKATAKELDVPVLALSQLSRAPEAGRGRKPQLSDLRESGALEQDADLVMFLWRKDDEEDTPTELIIGKQRNGPTGVVELTFIRKQTRFETIARARE